MGLKIIFFLSYFVRPIDISFIILFHLFAKDGNIYSEPPSNQNTRSPIDDEEIGITNPRNEKALEKMGEFQSVTYSGSKRVW